MLYRMLTIAVLAASLPAAASAQAAFSLPGQKQSEQQERQEPPPMAHIQPANALERTFIAALTDEQQRAAFRRQFLEARVSVAMLSNADDAEPAAFPIRSNMMAVAVFTSGARQDQVLGPNSPRRLLTGREALTLLSDKNIVLNPQLSPMLTLEPADIASWLRN